MLTMRVSDENLMNVEKVVELKLLYSFRWQHGIWFQAFVDDESVCSLAIPYLVFLLEEFIDFDGF